MLGNTVKVYDSKNMQIGNIVIGEKCIDAVFSGRTLYVLTLSGIYSFDAYSEYDFNEIKASDDNIQVTEKDYSEETTVFLPEETTAVTESEDEGTTVSASSFG
jgi:hypothetical protein